MDDDDDDDDDREEEEEEEADFFGGYKNWACLTRAFINKINSSAGRRK